MPFEVSDASSMGTLTVFLRLAPESEGVIMSSRAPDFPLDTQPRRTCRVVPAKIKR